MNDTTAIAQSMARHERILARVRETGSPVAEAPPFAQQLAAANPPVPIAPAAAPEITCTQEDRTLVLEAYLPPELLPTVPAGTDLQVNLGAVIERKDGQFEYWTLRHVAAQPDFHARDTFVLTLATATHKAS